jgi:chromosome segregation ATPase
MFEVTEFAHDESNALYDCLRDRIDDVNSKQTFDILDDEVDTLRNEYKNQIKRLNKHRTTFDYHDLLIEIRTIMIMNIKRFPTRHGFGDRKIDLYASAGIVFIKNSIKRLEKMLKHQHNLRKFDEIKKERQRLMEQNEQLRSEKIALEDENKQLENENEQNHTAINTLIERSKQLEHDKNVLNNKNGQLQYDITSLAQTNKKLEENLSSCVDKLKKINEMSLVS